jgi:hypothetical protein
VPADDIGRLIHVADPDSNYSMAIADDSLKDDFTFEAASYSSLPAESKDAASSLILQIRAARILGRVWSFTRRQSYCSKKCLDSTFWELDSAIRPLSMIALQRSAINQNTPCVTSPIIFM